MAGFRIPGPSGAGPLLAQAGGTLAGAFSLPQLDPLEAAHVISSGDLRLDVLAENLKKQYKTILLDNQRLEDVVKLLNTTYKVNIRIDNPALKDCRITTEFLNEDLDTILMVISQTLEVTILKEKNNEYVIKGLACIQ